MFTFVYVFTFIGREHVEVDDLLLFCHIIPYAELRIISISKMSDEVEEGIFADESDEIPIDYEIDDDDGDSLTDGADTTFTLYVWHQTLTNPF